MLKLKRNVMMSNEYGDWRIQYTILSAQWSDQTLEPSNINQDDLNTTGSVSQYQGPHYFIIYRFGKYFKTKLVYSLVFLAGHISYDRTENTQ